MATIVNLRIDQGSTFEVIFRLFADDTVTTRFNLTGYSARMKVRQRGGGQDIVWAGNSTLNGITIASPVNGEIKITIAATESEDFDLSIGEMFAFDLEIVIGGVVKRVAQGQIFISPEVTKT